MICPYNYMSENVVLQWNQESHDDGSTNLQQIENTSYKMMECPKEGCAVWYEGRCHYAAVSLENR